MALNNNPQPLPDPHRDPVLGVQYPPLASLPIQPSPPVTRRRRRFPGACLGCALILSATVVCGSCSLIVGAFLLLNNYGRQADIKLQQAFAPDSGVASTGLPSGTFQTTRIYDRDGNELHQLFDQGRRTQVKLADISKNLIDATIAVEDSTFYSNPGIDVSAMLRAGLNYFRAGGGGGASTITQQLVRDVVFDYAFRNERSARRKVEEILMALALTREKPKDQILEMYLNVIYYGNLAYGIEAASQTYFNKSAKDLTLAEAAMLAGLPQAPADLDPLNPDPTVQSAVLARQKVVLDLMVTHGKITSAQADAAQAQPLNYADPNVNLHYPHFTLYAEQELKDLLPSINLPPTYLNTGGLSVYTTLDAHYEDLAEQVAKAQIANIKVKNNANNAAVIILQPGTGQILAMMGSVDYNDNSIAGRVNVTIAPRQPGSAMKPLMYAAAMEHGYSPASVLWDVETHIGDPGNDYSPTDYDHRFHGPVRLRDALANSYNIPAVQTLRNIGVPTLLSYAERVGVRSLGTDASKYGLALTLGGGELTPLELTQAYSVFANQGNFVPATSILCILNSDSYIVYQYNNGCQGHNGKLSGTSINATVTPKAVLDPRIAFMMRDILGDNAARTPAMGPNSPLRTDGITSSVKTGTTNDFRDNWTVGFTRNVAIGVWVGNTDDKPMQDTTGLTGAAPIWHDVLTGIYTDPALRKTLANNGNLLPDDITPPAGVSRHPTCNVTAIKDPSVDCPPGRSEWMFDSPPLAPDAKGNLVPAAIPFAPTAMPATGPQVVAVDPGVIKVLVHAMNTQNLPPIQVLAGRPPMPPPQYCLVPNEVRNQVPDAVIQTFIRAPNFPDEDLYARIYAQNTGLAIQPHNPCTAEMLLNSNPSVSGVVARITSPQPGDTVKGNVIVSGIVSWQPGQALFYKMEMQGPQFPQWTTFSGGQASSQPVINGTIGNFGAEGLQPGIYKLRITIIGKDANVLLTSGETPVNVTGQ